MKTQDKNYIRLHQEIERKVNIQAILNHFKFYFN